MAKRSNTSVKKRIECFMAALLSRQIQTGKNVYKQPSQIGGRTNGR